MSTGKTSALPPSSSTSFSAPFNPSRPRAIKPIRAPCCANLRAVARPTPADAPVITTTSDTRFISDRCLFRQISGRSAWSLVHRNLQHLRDMQRLAIGSLPDLFTATEAVCDDERVLCGTPNLGKKHLLAARDGDIVMIP